MKEAFARFGVFFPPCDGEGKVANVVGLWLMLFKEQTVISSQEES